MSEAKDVLMTFLIEQTHHAEARGGNPYPGERQRNAHGINAFNVCPARIIASEFFPSVKPAW
jgi:hypothetical protein